MVLMKTQLTVFGKTYEYYNLYHLAASNILEQLPYSLKVLLENLYRHSGQRDLPEIKAILNCLNSFESRDISFFPTRILMQDFTGVPALADLAALRDAAQAKGYDPEAINPLIPVDLVIDHSVTVDEFGSSLAFQHNVQREYQQNQERYRFLRWGQSAFKNLRVVPPGMGICHQVNLEYLAQVVWVHQGEEGTVDLYPDTVLGTDSHTTMVNGLSVLGWGVGGIEAEAAMLGKPLSLLIPQVVGVELKGCLPQGSTATDLVLTLTHFLRQKGVVGKFVEFFGEGLDHLTLADRATLANMAPEYGATCAFFPIDQETLNYLKFTGRSLEHVAVVEAYARAQGLWRDSLAPSPVFHETLTIHLKDIAPTLAGPKRPQDRLVLTDVPKTAQNLVNNPLVVPVKNQSFSLKHHDVVIAALTSCTNTSNPSVMVGAGLLAQKARAFHLTTKPWVKTSLAPGSKVVSDYLIRSGLMGDLEALGFYLVGYGCTTCIGNSGPLAEEIAWAIEKYDLTVSSVLSGNRNFEGRIHPQVKANYLASPLLVVAYALAGTMLINFSKEPLGFDPGGNPIYLKDLWPTHQEIEAVLSAALSPNLFQKNYAVIFDGDQRWQEGNQHQSKTYPWQQGSTYIKRPPFLEKYFLPQEDILETKILGIFGDSITTDHISPAGNISSYSPAGQYLQNRGVSVADFNSYGARRGHDEVMIRGTFANPRLQNEMVPQKTGGVTLYQGRICTIYEASQHYQKNKIPLIVIAGREYGSGSSRDWAAKGTALLGVRAVIAESFERIHRSNLLGMGVLPLEFMEGMNRRSLMLKGSESLVLQGIRSLSVGGEVPALIKRADGTEQRIRLRCRIDTEDELDCFKSGGILPSVLNKMGQVSR